MYLCHYFTMRWRFVRIIARLTINVKYRRSILNIGTFHHQSANLKIGKNGKPSLKQSTTHFTHACTCVVYPLVKRASTISAINHPLTRKLSIPNPLYLMAYVSETLIRDPWKRVLCKRLLARENWSFVRNNKAVLFSIKYGFRFYEVLKKKTKILDS